MLVISVRDNENNRWKIDAKKSNKQRQKRTRGETEAIVRVRAKWFCCAFKLGFFQLTCKASIFKLNLGLTLSTILKQRELYELNSAANKYSSAGRHEQRYKKQLVKFSFQWSQ